MGKYKSYGDYQLASSIKIKCRRCMVIKSQAHFSTGQQDALLVHIAGLASKGKTFNATIGQIVSCTLCTGGNVPSELECSQCGKTKSRKSFNKTQIRHGDKRKCEPCVQEQLKMDAPSNRSSDEDEDGEDGEYSSESNPEHSGDENAFTSTGGASLRDNTSSAGGVSVPGTVYQGSNLGSRRTATDTSSTVGGVSFPSATNSNNGLPAGFNTRLYGQPSTPRSGASSVVGSNKRGFAKVPSAKKPEQPVVASDDDSEQASDDESDDELPEF